jgi:hypothetical protein
MTFSTHVASTPLRRRVDNAVRSSRVNSTLLVAAAVLIAALLADAALIALAAPSMAELVSLYVTTI